MKGWVLCTLSRFRVDPALKSWEFPISRYPREFRFLLQFYCNNAKYHSRYRWSCSITSAISFVDSCHFSATVDSTGVNGVRCSCRYIDPFTRTYTIRAYMFASLSLSLFYLLFLYFFFSSLCLPFCFSLFIRFLVRHNYIFGSCTNTRTCVHSFPPPWSPIYFPCLFLLLSHCSSLSFFLFLYRETWSRVMLLLN